MKKLEFIQLQKENEHHYQLFQSLMIPYNQELDSHKSRCTDLDVILKITRGTLNMQGPHDRHLELCYDGNILVGFLYGKVDHAEHKGYVKPNYGYIMEFYVKPEFRRKGYGQAMFQRLNNLFVLDGVTRMYLTADPVTGKPFWESIGFECTGEKSPENGLYIYEADVQPMKSVLPDTALPLNIKPALPEHAGFISMFYEQNRERLHGSFISISGWRKILSKKDSDEQNFLICKGETPAAWMRINGLMDGNMSWISMLIVNDKNQRQGIGTFAINYAEEYIRIKGKNAVGIHTTEDNIPAQNLYKRCGYLVIGYGECITGNGQKQMGYTFKKILREL